MPWSLCRLGLPCLLIFLTLALAFAAMVQWCWFRNDALLKCGVLGIHHFVFATLLRKGRMMVMRMMVLVLRLQHRVYVVRALSFHHLRCTALGGLIDHIVW